MSFFWQAILVEGGLAVIAILVDLFFALGLHYREHCQFNGETLQQIAWGLLPLIVGYIVLLVLPFAALRRIDRFVRELFWQHMGHWKLWQLALVAALAGIGEELLFRGLLQLGFCKIFDLWLAILFTSLIFGLAHAITPTYCVLAFVISVYFGYLFAYTDNLVVSIAIHALYDFFVFLYIMFTPRKNAES
ncbi:MAG: CPBP family intramembrane metalloprotease [Planctomycetaceae bacterium]|nr:CPBP family intramembrane metalloprotease [Planctomycetaceae bacterium]